MPHPAQRVIEVVIELLESGGYEAVQLREVAQRARIGLGTVYKMFSSREDLIVSAIEYWMDTNTYAELAEPAADESLYDGMMRVFRDVFEPWEANPGMLKAYVRARSGPGGERLQLEAADAITPLGRAVLEDADPDYIHDIQVVLTSIAHGVIARFVAGDIDITEVLPILERAVFRLTANNAPLAKHARRQKGRPFKDS